jgi:two-component system, OmpR family, alkaline phosphatase synthesis response regulator PhoP
MGKRILLIEDEPRLVRTLSDRLRAEDYQVESATDGETGLEKALNGDFDLIVLDVMLPGRNGFDVCRDLRHLGIDTPIIMLTARGEVTDCVVGLKLGADDYVPKPFKFIELQARIEVQLRRAAKPAAAREIYRFDSISVDCRRAVVERDGRPIELKGREISLLCYLVKNRGVVLTRDQLLNEVWGYDAMPTTRTVDVHIASLRQKIEPVPTRPRYILTVHGLGYKFAG